MRLQNVFATAFLGILLAGPSAAQGLNMRFLGDVDCGSWHPGKRIADNDFGNALKIQWVLGFLGGEAWRTKVDLLDNITVDGIYAWMDNYCLANPLKSVQQGAFALSSELAEE